MCSERKEVLRQELLIFLNGRALNNIQIPNHIAHECLKEFCFTKKLNFSEVEDIFNIYERELMDNVSRIPTECIFEHLPSMWISELPKLTSSADKSSAVADYLDQDRKYIFTLITEKNFRERIIADCPPFILSPSPENCGVGSGCVDSLYRKDFQLSFLIDSNPNTSR